MGAACSNSSSANAANPPARRSFAVIVLIGPPGTQKLYYRHNVKKDVVRVLKHQKLWKHSVFVIFPQAICWEQSPKQVSSLLDCVLHSKGSELGNEIKAVMERGELVSDELLMKLLREEVKKLFHDSKNNGVIFDGFPRTVEQAKMVPVVVDSIWLQ